MQWATILVYLSLTLSPVSAQTADDVKRLMKKLFKDNDYNKWVRPVNNQQDTVNVSVDYYLTSITDFDVAKETLSTSGHLSLSWTDEFLSWNPGDYNGLFLLFVPQDLIWKPDIELRNSAHAKKSAQSDLTLWLDDRGTVMWEPVQVLESTCDVDTRFFPFDTQVCEQKFIAWSYAKGFVNLKVGKEGVMLGRFSESSTWELVSSSADDVVDSQDSVAVFSLTLKRKSRFYVINIIIPIILLSVLTILAFILPIPSGERAGYAITIFLSFAVFMTLMTDIIPDNSDVTSYLDIYLALMLGASTAMVIISLAELRLVARDVNKHPPGRLSLALYSLMLWMKCGCCRRRKKIESRRVGEATKEQDGEANEFIDEGNTTEHKVDWEDVVSAIDFHCFWIFFLTTFLITLILFIYIT